MVECNRRGNNRETDNQTTVTDLIAGYFAVTQNGPRATEVSPKMHLVKTTLVNRSDIACNDSRMWFIIHAGLLFLRHQSDSVLIRSMTATCVQLNVNFVLKQLLLCRITVEQNGIKRSMRCIYKVITVQINQKQLLTRIIERMISTWDVSFKYLLTDHQNWSITNLIIEHDRSSVDNKMANNNTMYECIFYLFLNNMPIIKILVNITIFGYCRGLLVCVGIFQKTFAVIKDFFIFFFHFFIIMRHNENVTKLALC